MLIGCGTIAGVVLLSSLSGYVFARIEFRGKQTLFLLVLALMMVPGILTLIPSFMWFKEFPLVGGNDWLGQGGTGFLNSHWVLLIPYISGGQVFGIFLCRSFFESLPEELFEAARIDGASEFGLYWRVAVPVSRPILATLAILAFVGAYNDYVWPLVAISDGALQTFSVGITLFAGEGNLEPGETMAESACRELREESGYNLPRSALLPACPVRQRAMELLPTLRTCSSSPTCRDCRASRRGRWCR